MSGQQAKISYTPASGKTSLVDRMNLSIHLRKYIKLLTRRWVFLLLGAAIGAGWSWYKARQLPDIFQARSKVALKPLLVGVPKNPVDVYEEQNKFYLTQIEYMGSDEVIGKVKERMKDYRSLTGKEPSVSYNASQGMSASILMTVTSTEFDYARQFAEFWAQEFKAFKDRKRQEQIGDAATQASLEYEREKDALQQTDKELADFIQKHGGAAKDIGDSAQAQLDRLKRQQDELRFQRIRLQNLSVEQYVETEARKNAPTASKPQEQPSEVNDTNLTDPATRLSQLAAYTDLKKTLVLRQQDRERWAATLKPKHRFMMDLEEKISETQRQIKLLLKFAKEDYDANIKSLELNERALQSFIDEAEKKVESARRIQEEAMLLQAKLARQTERTRQAEERRNKLIEAAPSEDEKLEIVEAGKGDPKPIGPDRQRLILQGLLVGLAIGFGIIYFLNRLDDRLELAEDIEDELDEPVLGQVPQLDKQQAPEGVVLVTKLEQHNTFAEAMRGVRSAFLFGARDKAKQVIVVTSAVPGDGKTTITVNFATTLARAGHKVLLVDSDLRRGNVHQYFGLKRDTGFTEVLIGQSHWEDVVRQTPVESLHLITTGSLPGNPGELLISPITEQFLAEARQQYDYVLFDCPPLTSIDDTFCLLSLVDGLLFVVKAGHTSMRFAKNALANVRHRGSPILGIVLNGITTDHPGYYYYYYYHDYYKTAQDAAKKGEILPESQPGVKMAPRRGSSGTVNGVAHTPGSGSLASAEESQKAALFKARRAAQKGDTQPPENPPPSAPNDPPPSAA